VRVSACSKAAAPQNLLEPYGLFEEGDGFGVLAAVLQNPSQYRSGARRLRVPGGQAPFGVRQRFSSQALSLLHPRLLDPKEAQRQEAVGRLWIVFPKEAAALSQRPFEQVFGQGKPTQLLVDTAQRAVRLSRQQFVQYDSE
jgi:hypothetical protein